MNKSYCKPLNAGLASETSAVCRRLAKLVEGLDEHINGCVVDGAILDDILAFRLQVRAALEAEGWSMSYSGTDRLRVRPPGHKEPFKRTITS